MTITYHSGKRLQGIEEDRERTQGNRGGANAGSGSSIYGGGGGGGAGAVGADSVGTGYGIGGAGGNGTASSITGSPVTYAGGGGGGGYSGTSTGGSGGGGAGAEWSGSANGTSGTDYYGGGGGGCSYSGDNNGGSGGKGVVILQFTTSGISYSQTGTYDTPDTSTVSGKTILRWTGSGTFVLSSGTPDVEYLVVAGGGGGGGAANNTNASGGGGAGGMLTGTISSMSSATYTVTIGDGGIAGVADLVGGVGGNSVFSNITATGGGGGACNSNKVGRDGGSGSGAASASADIGGVSLKATTVINVPAGSRFEETDTRKFYTKDVNGWQEKGTELGYRHDSTYAQNQPAEANPFTTINKQHFVEWFSGKQIPSYWDYNQLVATVTPSMYDDVGGGYRLTTNTATNAKAEIRFAGKRQFDLASSECIVSMRYDNVAYSRCMAGLSAGSNITNDQTGHNHYTFGMQSNENLSYLYTKNSSGNTQVSSGNNPTTSWQTAKMVSNGSKVELYLLTDGVFVLSCEDSTYPPTGNADPYYGQWTPTAVSTWSEISYFEAYNT